MNRSIQNQYLSRTIASAFAAGVLATAGAFAQTTIDLRTQTKSVDFSAAAETKPMKTGTTLPATCVLGDMFFNSSAPAGQNVFGCVSANTWAAQSGVNNTGVVDFSAATETKPMKTGVSLPSSCNVGDMYFNSSAAAGQNLYGCTTANTWTLQSGGTGSNGIVDYSSATETRPLKTGVNLPSTCNVGDLFFNSSASVGQNIYGCTSANTWALESGSGGSGGSATASNAGNAGVGLFLQQVGSNLQFKNINPGSSRLVALDDTTNKNLVLDVAPGNLDLSTLGGSIGIGQISNNSKQGSGTKLALFGGGTFNANDCAKFDSQGNLISAGGACTTGGGGGAASVASDLGIVVTQVSASAVKVGVDTSVVPSYLTNAATLNYTPIAAATCSELTLPLIGALTGDAVAPGWPFSLEAGLSGIMYVGSRDTVNVRLCNGTTGGITPASNTFRATIVRSF